MTLVLLGVFALVAGISYVFTWKEDQDKILNNPFSALGEGDLVLANWLGRLGAVTGNALVYWGFGISALVLPVLVIGFGLRKFLGVGLQTWYARASKSVLAMVYLSMLLAFMFSVRLQFPWEEPLARVLQPGCQTSWASWVFFSPSYSSSLQPLLLSLIPPYNGKVNSCPSQISKCRNGK
ncbi:MAG: DNA translocase FtsK 4TM domain-containing protein [Saprospiraceae bacterium]|nr:DNA translocase FtsK 4TM domain-containing protein [Candidatus Opimibacter iunctus]